MILENIATDQPTIETAMAFQNGQSTPSVEGFVFELPEGNTNDPDEPTVMAGQATPTS